MQTSEKPRLEITPADNEPVGYRCSACGQIFILPEDRSPRDAAIELLAAYQEHVVVEHAREARD
jgi:hypothetical protein